MPESRYLLIVNPEAGSHATMAALPSIEEELRRREVSYEFHFTEHRGHATRLVIELGTDFDVIVSVGGDGTINEVINGLPDLNKPLGMIPIGTGNDFARSCCVPLGDVPAAIDVLLAGDIRKLDVGEVNGHRFINVMGLGFEGRANDIGQKLKFLKGTIKYLVAIGTVFLTYRRIPLRTEINAERFDEPVFLISIGNGWNVGGGLQLTPHARLDDGLLDIAYVRKITRWRILQVFSKLYDGSIMEVPEFDGFQTTSLTIEADRPVPVHTDGERILPVPRRFEIRVLPKVQEIIGNWSADQRLLPHTP